MNLDSAALRQVFDALDGQKRGYITVEKFTDALEKFYTSANTTNTDEHQTPSLTRMHSLVGDFFYSFLFYRMSIILLRHSTPKMTGLFLLKISSRRSKIFLTAKVIIKLLYFIECIGQEELKNKTMTINLRGRKVSIKPENYVLSSPGDGELDLRVSICHDVILTDLIYCRSRSC